MRQAVRPHDRARELIRHAREQSPNRDSAPAVANVMLTTLWGEIENDDGVLRHLVARGLNGVIRDLLKRHDGDDAPAPARARQVEMFPSAVRSLVEKIDRERVWVPSRDAFVELVPDAMSPDEMREAGTYLLSHGQDTINRGKLLMALAAALMSAA